MSRGWVGGSLHSEVTCRGGGGRVLGGPLYSEVQYIIGNGHIGSPSVNRMHMSVGRVQGVPCTVGSNASWVIVTWDVT